MVLVVRCCLVGFVLRKDEVLVTVAQSKCSLVVNIDTVSHRGGHRYSGRSDI